MRPTTQVGTPGTVDRIGLVLALVFVLVAAGDLSSYPMISRVRGRRLRASLGARVSDPCRAIQAPPAPVTTVKHLPKHLRPRYRYLGVGVESWPDADLTRSALQAAIWRAARALVGDAGSADLDLSVFRLAYGDGWGDCVIRVRRGEVDPARACLACVEEVDGAPVGLRVRGVAGTVRACEERYIRRPRENSGVRRVAFAGADRDARTRGDRADVTVGDGFLGATIHDVE